MPEYLAKYTEVKLQFVRKLALYEWNKPQSYFDEKGFVAKAGNAYIQEERQKYHFFDADDADKAKDNAREVLARSGERISSLDALFKVERIPLD